MPKCWHLVYIVGLICLHSFLQVYVFCWWCRIVFLFMDEQYPIVYVLVILFSLFIHRHVACIHTFAMVNNIVINMKSECFFDIVFFYFLHIYIFSSKGAALDLGSGEVSMLFPKMMELFPIPSNFTHNTLFQQTCQLLCLPSIL